MKYFLLFTFLFIQSKSFASEKMLEKIDSYRNPSDSYVMDVGILDVEDKKQSKFEVFLKGNEKTLIKTLLPKRDKGRNMLMLGENMWVFIPNLKRAMRVNMSQKLTGQAAIGDISRMRWAGDYEAVKTTTKGSSEVKLELNSKKKGLTYDKITVFAEKNTLKPIRALLKTKSGRVLKRAEYEDFKQVEGSLIPHRMILTDYLNDKRKSIVTIEKIKSKKLQDSLFNQRALK